MLKKEQAQKLANRIMEERDFCSATIDSGDVSESLARSYMVVVQWIGHVPIVIRSEEEWDRRKQIIKL